MKRLVIIMLLGLFVTTGFGQTPPITDGFQFPTYGLWSPNCNDFGGTCNLSDRWHTGEDVIASAGTPVLAPADGIVKHTINRAGYGNIVIIEHNINNQEYICSVNGHMRGYDLQVSVGQFVRRGDVLGFLGTESENGGWPPHFHLGINKGEYRGDFEPGCPNNPGEWWYSGYTRCQNYLNNWYVPTDFINSNQSSSSLLRFDFTSHSSDGWTTGYDTQTTSDQDPVDQNTWKVAVQGQNPGVVSPELPAGTTTADMILSFSAKVRGTGPDTYCQIWIKDDNSSWNHEVRINSVDGQAGNVVKRDYQYHEYTAFLDDAGDISIRQFSIELTQEANEYEEWIFDWVELSRGGVGGPEPTPTPIPAPTSTFTPTPLPHSWYVGTHATSEGVQTSSPYDPVGVNTLFLHTIPSIFSWLRVDNISGYLRVRWEWWDVDENYQYTFSERNIGDGQSWGWWKDSCEVYNYDGHWWQIVDNLVVGAAFPVPAGFWGLYKGHKNTKSYKTNKNQNIDQSIL